MSTSDSSITPPVAPTLTQSKTSEYLANERTFLAWIRTSIAVISLGFVVAKFSLWLRELASHLNPQAQSYRLGGASMPIGVAMMGLGGILSILAAWRYHLVNQAIQKGTACADRGLVIFVTVMVVMLCSAMIAYMLFTKQH
ncbi:MAG: DUF202 domain-containing protein [Bacteriovorax sp.]|nr:DUF202 domain-containing protein [Bacteriovorax sp.]